ncbi:translation initiation factor IF-2-like [Corvus hawaiiensis]|uniref:translation initiation factor IF-2-like n=1 Tax=Corvus hawaiiensis TaxID=134902 RepID=UPI0020192875|nr:translation initiation factor IF-2-like [Corvus hawaiiensis]
MRKGTGIHRHAPVSPAPPAEPPRGRADTSNRKLPLCGTETAAGLLAEPGRRRRRGDAGCRPDPAPRRGSFTPSPGAAQTRTPGPAPAAARGSLLSPRVRRSGQGQARPRRGKGRRGLLQPRPCRAAPPLPFPVPPAGSAAGAIPAPPPGPFPRGGKPGREQPPQRSSPNSPRTGTGSASRRRPGDPRPPAYPSALRPSPLLRQAAGGISATSDLRSKCSPRRGRNRGKGERLLPPAPRQHKKPREAGGSASKAGGRLPPGTANVTVNTAVKFPLPSRSLSPWGSHYQREFIRAASRGQNGNTHSPDAPHRCEGQRRPSPLASRPSLPAEVPRPGAAYLPGPPSGTATGHFSDTYRFPQEQNLHGFKCTSVNLNGFARRALKEAGPDGHRRGLRCSEQCPCPQPCHPVPAGCP